MRTTTQTRQSHGSEPGEVATLCSHSKDHPLSSIRPASNAEQMLREMEGNLSSHAPARLSGTQSLNCVPDKGLGCWLCVHNQHPSYCSPFIGRHHIGVGDGGSGSRITDYTPDTAFGTALTSSRRRTQRPTKHTSPSLSERKCCDASGLIAKSAPRMLKSASEPQGSLFANRSSQSESRDRQALVAPADFVFNAFQKTSQGRIFVVRTL